MVRNTPHAKSFSSVKLLIAQLMLDIEALKNVRMSLTTSSSEFEITVVNLNLWAKGICNPIKLALWHHALRTGGCMRSYNLLCNTTTIKTLQTNTATTTSSATILNLQRSNKQWMYMARQMMMTLIG